MPPLLVVLDAALPPVPSSTVIVNNSFAALFFVDGAEETSSRKTSELSESSLTSRKTIKTPGVPSERCRYKRTHSPVSSKDLRNNEYKLTYKENMDSENSEISSSSSFLYFQFHSTAESRGRARQTLLMRKIRLSNLVILMMKAYKKTI